MHLLLPCLSAVVTGFQTLPMGLSGVLQRRALHVYAADAALLQKADALHAGSRVEELFDCLSGEDRADDELAWRMARAYHDKAEETVDDDSKREALLREGLTIADESRQRCGSGPSLKWYAILLGRLGDFLPTKEKVGNSYKIKEALESAAELLPDDSSVLTALGQWCFKVASISWVERNAAKLLFGAPPESSYEEALGFAERSFAIRPSKKAAVLAGQSCKQTKRLDDAKAWMRKALELESVGEADAELDRQARAVIG
jgi:tetratricopeptide (TPR) repeat protein